LEFPGYWVTRLTTLTNNWVSGNPRFRRWVTLVTGLRGVAAIDETVRQDGDAIVTDAPIITSGAERMRRCRERRRQGKVRFLFELPPWANSGLVELRWLHPSYRDDHDAVLDAFRRFVAFALDMTRNTGR
jgi:hypothetical protein